MTEEQRHKMRVIAGFAADDERRKRKNAPPALPSPPVARPPQAVAAPNAETKPRPSPTLVVIRHLEVGCQQFGHGEELPPGLLSSEHVNKLVDQKQLAEYDSDERRSLHRLFHRFSGALEPERLTAEETRSYAL